MTELPPELKQRLSSRILDYAGIAFAPAGPSPNDSLGLAEVVADDDLAMAGQAAIAFDLAYRGLSVVSLGGPLEGEVRLGVNGRRPVRNAGPGLTVFRCASHPTIQCSIVSTVDGRIGCSWSNEFTPLFDSVGHFLENAAAWGNVQGWRYVAVGDVARESVVHVLGDIDVVVPASGEMSGWWVGSDIAVVFQQYLNPSRSRHPQVFVLARTLSSAKEAGRRIGDAVPPMACKAAEMMGVVPTLPA